MNGKGKLKIDLIKGGNTLYIPYIYKDKFIVEKVDTPVFEKFKYEEGDKIEINYNASEDSNMKILLEDSSSDKRYDYIKFKENGDANYNNNQYGNIWIRGGEEIRIDLINDGNIFYIPYEYKENFIVDEVNTPVFEKYNIAKNEKIELSYNASEGSFVTILLDDTASYKKYDYIKYNGVGFLDCDKGASGDLILYSNDKIKIQFAYGEDIMYIPYEYKSYIKIKNVNTPVFYERVLSGNNICILENQTLSSTKIKTTSSSTGSKYDITYYNSNGGIVSTKKNSYGDIKIPSGNCIAINVTSGDSMILYIPYEIAGSDGATIEGIKIKDTIGWYDILNNELKITKRSEKVRNIVVDVNWGEEENGEILLKQGEKTVSSNNGQFNIVLGKVFDVGKDIYVVAKTRSGKYSKAKKLNLKIVDSNASVEFEGLSFEKYKIGSTSSKTPIISAIDFVMGFSNLPFTSEVDEETGTIKFVLGVEANKEIDFENVYKKIKQGCRLTKNVIKPVKYSLNEKWGWNDTEVIGYMECREVNGRLIVIGGGIEVSSGGSLAFGYQLWAGPVPIYIQLGIGMDLGFVADILRGENINSGKLDLSGNIIISPNISPEGGVGVNKVLSVGIKGKLALNSTINLYPVDTKFSLTGGIGLRATALCFEYELPLVSGEWAINGKADKNNLLNNEEYDVYNVNNYSIMDRSYVDNTSEWKTNEVGTLSSIKSRGNENIEILQSELLPITEPIITKINNKKILIYIRDNQSRSLINRTELVYSIYNEEKNIWDSPKAIDDDKTADFYPSVAYDDNNLFVVWQNVKKVISDNSSIKDIAKNSEIVVSKFDLDKNIFTNQTILTNNSTLDIMPEITTSNGRAYVTWVNNSSNDIFGIEGANKLMSSSFDGIKWSSEKVLVSEVKSIESIDMAYSGDKVNIVYSMDTDNNLDTIEDKEIYYIDSENSKSTKITNNSVIDSNPTLVELEDGLGIIWYSDGKLLYSNNIDNLECKDLFDSSQYNGNDKFKIIQSSEDLAILWTKNIEDNIEVYGAIYDKVTGKLGQEVRLTNIGNRVKSISGIFDEKENIILASNVAERIQKQVDGFTYYDDGNSSLCVTTITPAQDIKINEKLIFIDDSEFIVNKKVPVSLNIENSGQKLVKKVKIELTDTSLNDGVEVNSSEIIEVNLSSGDNIDVETYFIPKEAKNYDIQIKVTPVEGEDVFMEDNIYMFNIGFEDISINRVYNSKVKDTSILNVSISNVSSIVTDEVILNVKEDSEEGEILYTRIISGLNNLNQYIEAIELDTKSIKFDENGEKILFVEVRGSANEKNIYNNSESIIISKDYLSEDINKDGEIDILDLALVAEKYNYSVEDNDKWDYSYDVNLDGVIDIFDLVILSRKAS